MDFVQMPRSAPFFITDEHNTILSQSLTFEPALLERAHALLGLILEASGRPTRTIFHQLDDDTVMRIHPLLGVQPAALAVFVEPLRVRISKEEAMERFGLSSREAKLLLLAVGLSKSEINAEVASSHDAVNEHLRQSKATLGQQPGEVERFAHLEHDVTLVERDDAESFADEANPPLSAS